MATIMTDGSVPCGGWLGNRRVWEIDVPYTLVQPDPAERRYLIAWAGAPLETIEPKGQRAVYADGLVWATPQAAAGHLIRTQAARLWLFVAWACGAIR